MNFVPSTPETYIVANSYLSLAEANEIFTADVQAADWAALTDDVKKILLLEATLLIDSSYSYKGSRTSPEQILEFPRDGSTIIPQAIKFATAVMTREQVAGTSGGGVITGGIKSEKVGELKTEYFGGGTSDATVTVSPAIAQIINYLRPFISNTARVVL